jgi:hypothetical protein
MESTRNDTEDRIWISNMLKYRVRMMTIAATSKIHKFLPTDLAAIVTSYYADSPEFIDAIVGDEEFITLHSNEKISLKTQILDHGNIFTRIMFTYSENSHYKNIVNDQEVFDKLLILPNLDNQGCEISEAADDYRTVTMRICVYRSLKSS